MQRVTDETRLAGQTGNASDLPIRRDATSRDLPDNGVDSGVQTVWLHPSR
jgi:hypothetical protein